MGPPDARRPGSRRRPSVEGRSTGAGDANACRRDPARRDERATASRPSISWPGRQIGGAVARGPTGGEPKQEIGRARLGFPPEAQGVLPSQSLEKAVELGMIDAGDFKIPASSIQPASLDLRLGEGAYRIRSSFVPDQRPLEGTPK